MDKKVLLLLIVFATIYSTAADCPDLTLRCPTGEQFTIGTCWSWRSFNCRVCHNIHTEIRNKCPTYSCGGSVSRWFGRSDGCSASIFTGLMHNTFRFRAACAVHDLCLATPGRPKESCDEDFQSNMLALCRVAGIQNIGIAACASTAGIAYRVARNHAVNFPDFARSCTRV